MTKKSNKTLNTGQTLFNSLRRFLVGELLDVGRDVHSFDIDQRRNPILIAPGEEISCSSTIGFSCVYVSDVGGEELNEALDGGNTSMAITSGSDKEPSCKGPFLGDWTSSLMVTIEGHKGRYAIVYSGQKSIYGSFFFVNSST